MIYPTVLTNRLNKNIKEVTTADEITNVSGNDDFKDRGINKYGCALHQTKKEMARRFDINENNTGLQGNEQSKENNELI